jgi:protein TonB
LLKAQLCGFFPFLHHTILPVSPLKNAFFLSLWICFRSRIIVLKSCTMEKLNILTADLLDIIFEYRNKVYGAYELRRTYPKRIAYAIGGTVLVCLLFVGGTIFANGSNTDRPDMVGPEIELSNYKKETKPEPPLPPPPKVAPPPIAMTRFTPPAIVKDETVKPEDEIQDVEKMADTKIGPITTEGVIDDRIVAPPVEKPTGIASEPKVALDVDGIFSTVQIEAQFTGGLEAWAKFLRKHLNSEIPNEHGAPVADYKVVVSFIVDRNGFISDVRAENDPGYGTAAEAVRVIRKSPNWTAAVQNGINVMYRQRQTITFQVREE